VTESRVNQPLQLDDKLRSVPGRKIELEQFDDDEPVALGVVGTIERAEGSGPDLMKNTERPERV
jgi:hypothetical protein